MSSMINKAKDLLSSDKHDSKHTDAHGHTATGTSATGTSATGTSATGTTTSATRGSTTHGSSTHGVSHDSHSSHLNTGTGAGIATGGVAHQKSTTQTHETVAPAVTQETLTKQVREEEQTVIDREHHVHHHQQRVQPVADHVVNPELHKHNVLATQKVEQTHEMSDGAKRALAEQQSAYQNTQTVNPTLYTKTAAVAQGSDVTHHHVHETVQPVIQREIIQPETIHTVKPVHEVIHERPVVHEATVEPVITMDQFKTKGGSLTGGNTVARETRPGEPQTLEGSHLSGNHKHTDAIGTAGHSQTK